MTYTTIGHVIAFAILISVLAAFIAAYWIITDGNPLKTALMILFTVVAFGLLFSAVTLLSF